MKKKLKFKLLKFKNNIISEKKYNQITLKGMVTNIFTEPRIMTSDNINVPEDCVNKKFPRTFYKGQSKNNKAHGWGIEILKNDLSSLSGDNIYEYYEGEWKFGKRHGYGESYDFHPRIGRIFEGSFWGNDMMHNKAPTLPLAASAVKSHIEGDIYKGQWNEGKKHGNALSRQFSKEFIGEYKNNNKFNGKEN